MFFLGSACCECLGLFLQTMCLGNGERIVAGTAAVKLLFETGEVEHASPGTLAECVSPFLLLASSSELFSKRIGRKAIPYDDELPAVCGMRWL